VSEPYVSQREFDRYAKATDDAIAQLRRDLNSKVERHDHDVERLEEQRDRDVQAAAEALRTAFTEAAVQAQKHREWTWQRALGVVTALGVLVGAWYEILAHR